MRRGWKKRFLDVWPYASTVTTLMFSVAAMVGAFIAWQSGADRAITYVLAIVDPSMAGIALLLTCVVLPEVFIGVHYRLPHVVALPTLYVVFVYGIKSLSNSSYSAILRFDGSNRLDLVWTQIGVLVGVWVVLCIVLSVIGALGVKQTDVK